MSKEEGSGFLKIDVESLEQVILKPDSLLLVAESKTKSGLYLPETVAADSGLKFFVKLVGENVSEYKIDDEVIFFDMRTAVPCEWKDKKVVLVDKYSINLAIRK